TLIIKVYDFIFFFFQAEDGIRDFHVTGVQTCALPIFVQLVSSCLSPPGAGPAARGFVPAAGSRACAPYARGARTAPLPGKSGSRTSVAERARPMETIETGTPTRRSMPSTYALAAAGRSSHRSTPVKSSGQPSNVS